MATMMAASDGNAEPTCAHELVQVSEGFTWDNAPAIGPIPVASTTSELAFQSDGTRKKREKTGVPLEHQHSFSTGGI